MNIDQLFKQKLANRKVNASSDLWNKLEAKLNATPANSTPTTSVQGAATAFTTTAKVALISVAAAAVAVGGYFIIDNQDADSVMPAVEQIVPKTEEPIAITTAEQPLTIKEKTENTTDITDFSNAIATAGNDNIEIDFHQPYIVNNTSVSRNYEPQITKTTPTQSNMEVTDPSPVQTPNHGKISSKPVRLSDKLQIPNVITPNNDGINDYFVIGNLDLYPDNTLVIWDRTGRQVFCAGHYQNNWNAQSLPTGTYFFKLLLKEEEKEEITQGLIEVLL
jgi:gliding motility-associated-like protein